MEKLQTEIQEIQAAIQSIRADRSPAPTLLATPPATYNRIPEKQRLRSEPPPKSPNSGGLRSESPPELGGWGASVRRSERSQQSSKNQPDDLAIAAERLSRISSNYLKKLEQPKPPTVHSLNEAFERLEAQAEQVNQLSVAQETAILKLKVIAEQVELDWKTSDPDPRTRAGKSAIHLPPLCEYLDTAIPHVERDQNGGLILTSRSVDLFKAEREAEFNAEILRHRKQHKRESSWVRRLWKWLIAAPQPQSRKRPSKRSTSSPFSIRDAVLLVGGAIATRVILDTVLAIFPGLWFPAIAIMAMPGAIAIYRSTLTRESGLIWGYRLSLILIGLLIGGRL
jgi:hypothetical protein